MEEVSEEAAKKAGRPPKAYGDMLQWFIDTVRPEHKAADALTELQLQKSMAATHALTTNLVNTLLGLTPCLVYIQPLKEEIGAMINENGGMVQKTTRHRMGKRIVSSENPPG